MSSSPRNRPHRRGRGLSRRVFAATVLPYLAAPALGAAGAAPAFVADGSAAAVESARSKGDRIARTALKYKGTRYRPGGNSPRGFDCSGFTQYVINKTLGIDIGQSVPPQWRFGKRIGDGKWRAGDLVFFKNTFERGLSHVGIYLGNNRFIHAENEDTGVVISRLDSDYYAGHYHGARRLT
jgi:cell wall-associated NlpC family hydrolase